MARQGRSSSSNSSELIEIDRQIEIVRDNLRELTEQAAAFSGAGDEERAAERIASQQARLDELIKRREGLGKKGK